MIYQLFLVQLKAKTSMAQTEELMAVARTRLLKIPAIYHVWCGKKIDSAQAPHDLFIAIDVQSMRKLKSVTAHPIYSQFMQHTLKPHAREIIELSFEMDPQKDVRYS